jgi:hypothetical protein
MPRRVLAGATGLSIVLALAACGGNSGNEAAADTAPSFKNTAADSDANAGKSSMRLTAVVNTSGLATSATKDRFIVKYRIGTTERVSPSVIQSTLDRRASTFPARARHLRRLGAGADIITADRKLNRKEARTFMQNIASDRNVEYVEVDTPMHIDAIPNDSNYSMQWGYTPNAGTYYVTLSAFTNVSGVSPAVSITQ